MFLTSVVGYYKKKTRQNGINHFIINFVKWVGPRTFQHAFVIVPFAYRESKDWSYQKGDICNNLKYFSYLLCVVNILSPDDASRYRSFVSLTNHDFQLKMHRQLFLLEILCSFKFQMASLLSGNRTLSTALFFLFV